MAPGDTRRSATRLVILGFLRERPASGYDIQQWIRLADMDRWAHILSGSIYYALKKMEEEGLVEARAEERTGDRLRKIFAITPRGEAAFRELVRESLSGAPHALVPNFALSVGWLDVLPPGECIGVLEGNIRRLEAARDYWEAGRAAKRQHGGLPPVVEALFDTTRQRIEADIALLRTLVDLVRQGNTGLQEARQRAGTMGEGRA